VDICITACWPCAQWHCIRAAQRKSQMDKEWNGPDTSTCSRSQIYLGITQIQSGILDEERLYPVIHSSSDCSPSMLQFASNGMGAGRCRRRGPATASSRRQESPPDGSPTTEVCHELSLSESQATARNNTPGEIQLTNSQDDPIPFQIEDRRVQFE
jgi:hypothetical protein